MSKSQHKLAEKLKQYIPNGDGYNSEFANDLADVIEYLSKDEQEPVAWMYKAMLAAGFRERTLSFGYEPEFEGEITPLYAHPPKRQPLSDEEIKAIGNSINKYETLENGKLIFARAIEKAHGIGE